MDDKKARIMKNLNVSAEEADEIIEYDKRIDRGERCEYDLDPIAEKLAKKFANVGTKKPTVYKFDKRKTKKENPTKTQIIAEIAEFLAKKVENLQITNAERQIYFELDSEKFELTLVQKRKAK